MITQTLKLCLITHAQGQSFLKYQSLILEAIQGGVTSIQLREKSKSYSELREWALLLKNLLSAFHIPLIINDHVELAKDINADGVHLGQSDGNPYEARHYLGPNKIIGLSVESWDQLEYANQLNCIDYIAASAIFPTQTKTNCKMYWGLDGLNKISKKSTHPVIGIGGIDTNNIADVINHGACGAAIIGAIHNHPHPKNITQELMFQVNTTLEKKHARLN